MPPHHGQHDPLRCSWPHFDGHPPPLGSGRRHCALQFPPDPSDEESRAGIGRRQHFRAEAVGGNVAGRTEDRGDLRQSRSAARGAQCCHRRWPDAGRSSIQRPSGQSDPVYRFHCRRTAYWRRVRAARQEIRSGNGRQEPAARDERCQPQLRGGYGLLSGCSFIRARSAWPDRA